VAERILARVRDGETLTAICNADDALVRARVYEWMRSETCRVGAATFGEAVQEARAEAEDVLRDEARQLPIDLHLDYIEQGPEKVNQTAVAIIRMRMESALAEADRLAAMRMAATGGAAANDALRVTVVMEDSAGRIQELEDAVAARAARPRDEPDYPETAIRPAKDESPPRKRRGRKPGLIDTAAKIEPTPPRKQKAKKAVAKKAPPMPADEAKPRRGRKR
jgi:hypothetical protein